MMQNRDFAKPINDGAAIEYAPVVFAPNPNPPTEAEYNERGYYRLGTTSPAEPAPEGKHWEFARFEVEDGLIVARYNAVEDPPAPPRRWSRLSIKGALADAHALPAARQYLSSVEIKPDYTAWEALTDCDYIEEGYGGSERWNALLDGAAAALGKTREEIDAFLDAIPTEVK